MSRGGGISISCPGDCRKVESWHNKKYWRICLSAVWAWYHTGKCLWSQVEIILKETVRSWETATTQGALHQAIACAHFQTMVWNQDLTPYPQLPPATEYGWEAEEGKLVPVTAQDPPAPATIIHLIKCGCKKTFCMSHCSCRSQNLNCTEMCLCGADEEVCANVSQGHLMGIDKDEDDDEPHLNNVTETKLLKSTLSWKILLAAWRLYCVMFFLFICLFLYWQLVFRSALIY